MHRKRFRSPDLENFSKRQRMTLDSGEKRKRHIHEQTPRRKRARIEELEHLIEDLELSAEAELPKVSIDLAKYLRPLMEIFDENRRPSKMSVISRMIQVVTIVNAHLILLPSY